ncbi:MAG TPA: tetratricopeptide repeat protein [Pirellulales bacterium]|nr:tetratricopeptide repeat protein [Pirellulales bacterium]
MAEKRLYSWALIAGLAAASAGCATTTSPLGNKPSWMSSLGQSVKSGTGKVAAALTPSSQKTDEPTPSPNGKAGPSVFVAMAQLLERNERYDAAEAQYKKALDADANNLAALMGYARMEDRRNNLEQATKLYQRAAKRYPKDPSVHNDLGLCYHRRGQFDQATKELKRAIELDGKNKLYHDNLASVYVDQGKTKEALAQLVGAHGDAIGHYNLGFLLEQKQSHEKALVHFRKAAETDPSLTAAQEWVSRLSPETRMPGSRPQIVARPLPVVNQTPANPYVAPKVVAPTTVEAQAIPASGAYAADPSNPRVATRGIQFPQAAAGAENAGDAMPPIPETAANRLPSVVR